MMPAEPTRTRPAARCPHGRSVRAFTMVEIMMAVLIMGLLLGLLIGGFKFASRRARAAANTAAVEAIRQAVSKFTEDFGFPPPLVKDMRAATDPSGRMPAPLGGGTAG